jgi:hypothetical protein
MSLTTQVPAIIDYLVNSFTAASTLGAAANPVTIIDGPEVFQYDGRALWVGVENLDEPAPETARSTQRWVGMGARAIDEDLSVACIAQGWGGDQKFRAARLDTAAIMSAVEDIIRNDPSLTALALWTNVTDAVWRQGTTDKGAAVRLPFRITSKARIGA